MASDTAKPEEQHEEEQERHYHPDVLTIFDLFSVDYTPEEITDLYNLIVILCPEKGLYGTARIDYFIDIEKTMKAYESRNEKIKNRYAYMKKILKNRINEM